MDDAARFSALYRAHYPLILAYARRRVDEDTARDVAAETFLIAWRRLAVLPEPPLPWLYTVARQVLANEIRSRTRRDRLTAHVRAAAAGGVPTVQPDHADAVADRWLVARTLAELSPRDQEALQLTEWEDLAPADAARVLGCTATAFKIRLHRARRRFAARLAEAEPTAHPAPPVPRRTAAVQEAQQ